jgi:SAM-dependent methyltransferase
MTEADRRAEANNRELWDELAPVHFRAYREVALLREGGTSLDEIELQEIGSVAGKSLLHLQCHIGTDTLSWARQGARVSGVDFSPQSLALAQQLRRELGLEADFIQSDIYDLPGVLSGAFDIVYTSRGVLCWLRDLAEWGRIITHFLRPGGVFYIMESHPFLNMFEETEAGELAITYPYFHRAEPTCWDDEGGDYADESYVPQHPSYEWDWAVSDIQNSLLGAGLQIEFFREYDRLFFKRFPCMVEVREGWYECPYYAGKLPLMFTLRARKPVEETPE